MHWITRERPKVGRIGCAWLIRRFVDPEATFHFVRGSQLPAETERLGATPFHVEGTPLSRQGDVSSFEAVCAHYQLQGDPALDMLARIVNTADITRSPYQMPEGAGLRAILDGFLLLESDDHAVLVAGMRVYDALYAYCQEQLRRQASARDQGSGVGDQG